MTTVKRKTEILLQLNISAERNRKLPYTSPSMIQTEVTQLRSQRHLMTKTEARILLSFPYLHFKMRN